MLKQSFLILFHSQNPYFGHNSHQLRLHTDVNVIIFLSRVLEIEARVVYMAQNKKRKTTNGSHTV